jgi:sulfur-oxidizing protein SoxZ
MADSIKVRAKLKGDVCEVKALIKHPMETGLRKDSKTGEIIPAHFIQEVVVKHNGKAVLNAEWGGAISQNPYLSFNFKGASKDDTIELSWKDNKGETDSTSDKIS